MNVKLVRMSSGEDLILNLIEEKENYLVVEDAIVAVPTGTGQLGFAPWSPLLDKRHKQIEVSKNFVVYVAEPSEDIVENYEKMLSPIAKPPSKKLII